MGGKSKITVGFRYFFGIHMGLCRGAIDELVEIKVGGRTAWSGSATANQTIDIDAPELFGGDDREGGIVGPLDVMMGEPDQPVNANLAAMLGGLVPAFRGVTSLFFDGQVSALNPYPKPWKMRCRRALKGWESDNVWNPLTAIIDLNAGAIKAMNPAHIIYQCTTDRSWGRGLPAAKLDITAFTAAAQALFDEGFGLCMSWNRQDSIENFIQAVLDHIGAAYYTDRVTGLVTLKLIRDNYDPALLPLFTPDTGLLGMEEDESSAQGSATNELIVKYTNPIDGLKGQVRVQNTASITALGAKSSRTVDYPGIPTSALALRAGQRDLLGASGILKRFKVRLDRRGYKVQPGSVFRVSDPLRGIANIVLRAGRVDDSPPHDGVITASTVEDVFSLAATSFVEGQVSNWIPPNLTPVPIAVSDLMEASYRDLVRASDPATIEALPSTAGFLAVLAQKPNGLSLGYDIRTRLGIVGAYTLRGRGGFSPTATLAADLAIDGVLATVTGGIDLDQVEIGSAAIIEDEIVRVDSIDLGTGSVGLGHGCVDTVPAEHLTGARIWFFEDSAGADPTEYSETDNVQVKLLTATGGGVLPEGAAVEDSIVMAARHERPYAPGNFKINGVAYPTTEIQALSASWSHRDRLLQQDQLVDTLQGNVGPEPGTTYTVRIFDGIQLIREVPGLTGNTFTYANEAEDGGPFNPIRLTLHAVRDGHESWQVHDWTVPRDPAWTPPPSPALILGFEGPDQSTAIIDESTKQHAVVVVGAAEIDTAQFHFGASALSLSGGHVEVPPAADFSFGLLDYTVAFWIRPLNTAAGLRIIHDQRPSGVGTGPFPTIYQSGTGLHYFVEGGNRISGAIVASIFQHVALCRSGGVTRMFVGGVQAGFDYNDLNDYQVGTGVWIGDSSFSPGTPFLGHGDEYLIFKGQALYTQNFSPPIAPFPRP